MGDEVVLFVEDLIPISSVSLSQCRICHEEEAENSKRLEVPCACSGTVKFAHRACIQRWCNEKGNTTCEICLQEFEPGYTAPPKKSLLADAAVTIRGSLNDPRQDRELYNPGLMAIVAADDEELENNFSDCSSAAEGSASFCRSAAVIFTMLLLVRDFLCVLASGTENYEFTILTLLLLRAGGIIIPLYVMIRTVTAIQNCLQRQSNGSDVNISTFQEDSDGDERMHRIVQINS